MTTNQLIKLRELYFHQRMDEGSINRTEVKAIEDFCQWLKTLADESGLIIGD